jgi:two-component system NtrC family sensor kinase
MEALKTQKIIGKGSMGLLGSILESSGDVIGVLDTEGIIIYVNPAVEETFQYGPKELMGNNFAKYLAGGEEELQRFIKTIWEAEKIKNYELEIIRKDGKILNTIISISLIKNGDKEITGILGITKDISERKKLIRETRKVHDCLETLIENSADAIVTTDIRGSITFVNRAAERIYGYQSSEAIGKPVVQLFVWGREEVKRITKLIKAKDGWLQDYETELLTKDNCKIPVNFTASFLRDESGKITEILTITRDISERKRLGSQLIQTEKLASMGELAAGVAHELNNPLGGILGYAQYILEKMGGESFNNLTEQEFNIYVKHISYIEREAQRCKTIIQNLLRFAQAYRVEHSLINVNTVLEETLVFTQHQLQMYGITLVKNLEPNLPMTKGNAHQLQQVFANLIINARQAMPEGGTLTISTRSTPKAIEMEFGDTGCGIAQENLAKIFDPFFTTRKPGEGTGLGLSVSYGIIKEHHGEVNIKRSKGQGATFLISFPMVNNKHS